MPMNKYGAADTALTINGITIAEFGDTDPPITVSWPEEWSTIKDGIGGNGVRLDRVNIPATLSVSLLPGSDEVRQLLAIQKTGSDFTATLRQIGTQEKTVLFDGVMTQLGDRGRAGRGSVTDEVFQFRFNDSDVT